MIRWFNSLPAHRKVFLFLAGGMLTLVFDAFIAHFSWNRSNMKWNQWIPVVSGLIAFVGLSAVALTQLSSRTENRILNWNGAIGLIVGLAGVALHVLGFAEGLEGEDALTVVVVGKTLAAAPPIFAPAAFAGVGLLMMVLKRLTGAHRADCLPLTPVTAERMSAAGGR